MQGKQVHGPVGISREQAPRVRQAPDRQVSLVELEFPEIADDHWLRQLTERWPTRVHLRVCRPVAPEDPRVLQILDVEAKPDDLSAIERYVRNLRDLSGVHLVRTAPSRLFLRVIGQVPLECSELFRSGGFCLSCRLLVQELDPKERTWRIVVPRRSSAPKVIEAARGRSLGGSALKVHVRRFVPAKSLTPRQHEAIGIAHRLGYYDYPRRARLADVGRALAISRSATAELLRRAEAKVVARELEPIGHAGAAAPR
jgi:hypothetical protein